MASTAELYVYGIVPASVRAPSGKAIGGAPLRAVVADELAALVSEIEADALDVRKDELMAHSKVVEKAFSRGPVLPMRFGVVMPGEEVVRSQLLEPFQEELLAQLDAIDGTVELHVRAVYEEKPLLEEVVAARPDVGARSETLREDSEDATYYERIELGQLVAEVVARISEEDAARILEALEPLALACSPRDAEHERVAADVAFLVERSQLDAFDRAVDEVGRQNKGRMKIRYTGPHPPYSFVELPAQV